MRIQKSRATKFLRKRGSLIMAPQEQRVELPDVARARETVHRFSTEDGNFRDLWESAYFHAQDNPPDQGSQTFLGLYHAYVERLRQIIERLDTGENWQQQSQSALTALKMNEVLYSRASRIDDDDLLVWFATHGNSIKRSRGIVTESHEREKHRPKDLKVWQESFQEYDLYRTGKNVSQIAELRYGLSSNRRIREKIRRRIKQVEKLLNELGLSTARTR